MRLVPRQKWSYLRRAINYGVRFVIISLLLFLGTSLLLTSPAQAQTIGPATLPSATIGSPYSVQLLGVGVPLPPPAWGWSIVGGSLPPGLFLGATTGLISGTPWNTGTFTFIVQLDWGPAGPPDVVQQSYYIVVQPRPITILTTSLAEAKEGSTYSTQISVSGGTPPYAWSIIGGALPSGLTLDATTGTISGTPTRGTAGSHGFTVRVTDSSFPILSAQWSFTLTVKKGFYDAIVTIGSNLLAGETKVLVDGGEVAKLGGGESKRLVFPLGTRHTVTIEREVLHPTRTDIKFKADRDVITIDEFSPTALFNYDIYYQLTVTSPHGKTEGSGWYKADTTAKWSVSPAEIPMSGILGFFKGKLKPDYPSGTEIMDAPKTVTATWEPDYTMPAILIPLLLLFLVGATFGIYRLSRPPVPRPAVPPPAPPLPTPPAPPTIVVVEGAPRPRLETTREQLLEQFGQLLQKYEEEVKSAVKPEELPEAKVTPETQRLPLAEVEPRVCTHTAKNLLRTVVGNWHKKEERIITPPPSVEKVAAKGISVVTVWARDIYNEWEVFACSLPRGHSGNHKGATSKAYTLQNTIVEERTYGAKQKITPPKPHFTDELPVVDVAPHQVIAIEPAATPYQVITPDEVIPPNEPRP